MVAGLKLTGKMIKCMVKAKPFKPMALKGPFTILTEYRHKQRNKKLEETGL
jgi:hypothetical protein